MVQAGGGDERRRASTVCCERALVAMQVLAWDPGSSSGREISGVPMLPTDIHIHNGTTAKSS